MGIGREQATPKQLGELLTKMQLDATLDEATGTLQVVVPPVR